MDLRAAIAFALGEAAPAARPSVAARETLTPRELEVARLITYGLTNREIASQLKISTSTVGRHVAHIYNRLGFNARTQIAAWVVRHDAAE